VADLLLRPHGGGRDLCCKFFEDVLGDVVVEDVFGIGNDVSCCIDQGFVAAIFLAGKATSGRLALPTFYDLEVAFQIEIHWNIYNSLN
jgi:hypothetical protein